jgi:putative N6-adenine-specific DNA methylase
MKRYTCLITTSVGIAPTLHRELKYLWVKPYNQFETWLFVDCTIEEIAFLNVRVRTWSKIWMQLWENQSCLTFEELFLHCEKIAREDYIPEWAPLQIEAFSYKSDLQSITTLQSVAHKAVLNRIIWRDNKRIQQDNKQSHTIRIQVDNNTLRVYINTSWNALHERWRRTHAVQAPLKEHIAAALVLMTSRWYSQPLIDVCCWWWTIPIEAALIASNRAPWLEREFACWSFPWHNLEEHINHVKQTALQKIFDKEYHIQWYDIEHDAISYATIHAKNAWVNHCITFKQDNCAQVILQNNDTLITNPPYWKRIWSEHVDEIHDVIFHKARYCKAATIISWYEHTHWLYHPRYWKTRQTKNWSDRCTIYMHQNDGNNN